MGDYVHGYTEREAERLSDQSGILEELLHAGTRYAAGEHVLEVGCGIGAQTEILSRLSPTARFTSIDISEQSLARARERLAGRPGVCLQRANLMQLPFGDGHFDHVFVCFVLEHLDDPAGALLEAKRVLMPGGTITAIEGDHGSCFWHPETPASLRVWRCLIDVQQRLGHDPLIGRRLQPLLRGAGLAVEDVSPRLVYGDAGRPRLLDDMVNRIIVPMVETAREQALQLRLTEAETWSRGIAELTRSGIPPEGTFFYTWFKGIARKPPCHPAIHSAP